MAASFLLLWF
jgi:hypothetical protein